MSASKVFVTYKSNLASFEVANERFLGLFEPGRIRGFDQLFVTTPGLQFGLSHELTGIKKVAKDGTTESDSTGIAYTRQGTIAHFEGNVSSLAVNGNPETSERVDLVYFQHVYVESTGSNLGIIAIKQGVAGQGEPTLDQPTKQIILGTISMPPNSTQVLPDYWQVKEAKQVGGKSVYSKTEIDTFLAGLVDLTTDQTIGGQKTFTNLYATDTNKDIEVFPRINNYFTYSYQPNSVQVNDYLLLAEVQGALDGVITDASMLIQYRRNTINFLASVTLDINIDGASAKVIIREKTKNASCTISDEDIVIVKEEITGTPNSYNYKLYLKPIDKGILYSRINFTSSDLIVFKAQLENIDLSALPNNKTVIQSEYCNVNISETQVISVNEMAILNPQPAISQIEGGSKDAQAREIQLKPGYKVYEIYQTALIPSYVPYVYKFLPHEQTVKGDIIYVRWNAIDSTFPSYSNPIKSVNNGKFGFAAVSSSINELGCIRRSTGHGVVGVGLHDDTNGVAVFGEDVTPSTTNTHYHGEYYEFGASGMAVEGGSNSNFGSFAHTTFMFDGFYWVEIARTYDFLKDS